MPKRLLTAGGTVYTTGNQGGGDKKQGLVSTKNLPIDGAAVTRIRTRADGRSRRQQVFCMNQLGGVGRRWGQAAGPGNRGGVSAACAATALQSQLAHPVPTRMAQVSLAGLVLRYTYRSVTGAYRKVAGKTAIIQFRGRDRWVAWFASEPHVIFQGSYAARRSGVLLVRIIHDGQSADGSQSIIVLTAPPGPPYGPGTFVETLRARPPLSKGSGPYFLYRASD